MCEKLPADIRLCLDMPQLLPLLAQGSDTVRHQMTQLPPAAKPGMPDPAKIVGGELDAALAIARQVRQLSIGVKADAANLTLLSSLEPVPGSTLAAVLREQRPPSERYTRLLPANTLFGVVGGGMSGLHVLLKPYAESIAQFYEGMPGMSVNGIAMRDLLLQGAAIYTGDYAIGLLPDVRSNGVVFAEIIAVSDADKARKLMRDGIALTEKSDTNAPLGLCVKMRPARTYAGSEIQAFCYQMTPNPAAQQDPAPPPVMTIMSYLTNCTCEQTLVGKDMVVSFGRAGAIDQVIDRVRLGGDAQFYRNARAMFADNSAAQPNEISHMELTAAISMLLKLLPGDLGSRLPALPPGKGLGTIEICHGNSMVSMLRITTPEIRSLVQAGSALMSGNMPAGKDDADAMAPPRKRHAASVRPTAPTAPVSPTAPAEE